MEKELKDTIQALGIAFEQFKTENDKRIKELEAKGTVDPVLAEKVDKINADISRLSEMKAQLEKIEIVVARGQFPGGGKDGGAKAEHAKAFGKWMRTGVDAGLKDLEV
jgi:HK97 family phage major capsid protein